MKFCDKCDNMYYIGIDQSDTNNLIYYCRNCGNKDETIAEEGTCVLNIQLKKGEQKFNHIINEYTKLDPTLPRIYNIKCPNQSCKSNAKDNTKFPEVIYIRYDDNNLKYVYICNNSILILILIAIF
jgi:DNA-directed RNA polymerase subunit M/transcription elongation factor TFIIS